ncbi:MAG: hypothetical protein DMH00_13430 [Acidobacteria bacterium]|nr:MAG: hypothetical protein DMH00_13430 [Acidobacteriota bacterium]
MTTMTSTPATTAQMDFLFIIWMNVREYDWPLGTSQCLAGRPLARSKRGSSNPMHDFGRSQSPQAFTMLDQRCSL